MTVAISPALISGLSDDERATITALIKQLDRHARPNIEALGYYEAKWRLDYLGVTTRRKCRRDSRPLWAGAALSSM